MVSCGNICVLTTLEEKRQPDGSTNSTLIGEATALASAPSSEEDTARSHQRTALTRLEDEGSFEQKEGINLENSEL